MFTVENINAFGNFKLLISEYLLEVKINSKQHPQNEILVPLRGQFSNISDEHPSFSWWEKQCPTRGGGYRKNRVFFLRLRIVHNLTTIIVGGKTSRQCDLFLQFALWVRTLTKKLVAMYDSTVVSWAPLVAWVQFLVSSWSCVFHLPVIAITFGTHDHMW